MCFNTTKSARSKIAKVDIPCVKLLNKDLTNSFSKFLMYHFGVDPVKYKIGKVMPNVRLRKVDGDFLTSERVIRKGYHSFKFQPSWDDIKHWHMDNKENVVFRSFIIPKGTRYYENDTEYVSETIMLVE